MVQKRFRKGWMYSVAYAYPTSPDAVTMKRSRKGAFYIQYQKDKVSIPHIFVGPFDTQAQAEAELHKLPKGNPNGGKMARQTSSKTTTKRAKKKAVRRVAKKATAKRVSKKATVKRNPKETRKLKTRYWLSIKPERYEKVKKYFDGAGMVADKKNIAYFDNKKHAITIARKLGAALRRPITLESNTVAVKKK